MKAALVPIVLLLSACAPVQKPPQALSGDLYRTPRGKNLVAIAPGMPAPFRFEAVARIDSLVGAELPGWIFGVMPWPIWFSSDAQAIATDFPGYTKANSITEAGSRVVQLSWKTNPDGTLWLEDLKFELENNVPGYHRPPI